MALAFTDNDALSGYVQAFIDGIPYPSDKQISQQAMLLALQTLFRTNYLEGKEVSMLPAETETLVRLFMVGESDEKRFNEMIKVASESRRKPDLQTCFNMRERLPKETMYREQISEGLAKIIEDLEKALQERKKSFTDNVKRSDSNTKVRERVCQTVQEKMVLKRENMLY